MMHADELAGNSCGVGQIRFFVSSGPMNIPDSAFAAAESVLDALGDARGKARRARGKLRGDPAEDLSWWTKIVDASLPYTTIDLK